MDGPCLVPKDMLGDAWCYGSVSPVAELIEEKAAALLGCPQKATGTGDTGAEPRRMAKLYRQTRGEGGSRARGAFWERQVVCAVGHMGTLGMWTVGRKD